MLIRFPNFSLCFIKKIILLKEISIEARKIPILPINKVPKALICRILQFIDSKKTQLQVIYDQI